MEITTIVLEIICVVDPLSNQIGWVIVAVVGFIFDHWTEDAVTLIVSTK